jgi:hypothetical protein
MAIDYVFEGPPKIQPPANPATGLDYANNIFYVSSKTTANSPTQWVPINTGGNATELQGRFVEPTAPNNAQVLTWNSSDNAWEPANATGGGPATYNVLYASDFIWNQTDVAGSIANLSTPGSNTLNLNPCPAGLDTSNTASHQYTVYIYGTGTPEVANVTGGTCTSNLATAGGSGTIVVTTVNAHSAGFTVGTANTGIQEAVNAGTVATSTYPYVKLGVRSSGYQVYGTVYLHNSGMIFDGAGSLLECYTRSTCVFAGSRGNTAQTYIKMYNLTLASFIASSGLTLSRIQSTAGAMTITTSSNHSFVAGDWVSFQAFYTGFATRSGYAQVTSVPSATTIDVTFGSATFDTNGTTGFGFINLVNCAIENNGEGDVLQDCNVIKNSSNYFNWGVINDNDQSFSIVRYKNRAQGSVVSSANFPFAAHIFQRGDNNNAGIIYLSEAEISLQCTANGFLVDSGNSAEISNSVIQGCLQYHTINRSGLQTVEHTNVYQEASPGCGNPLYVNTPAASMGNYWNNGTIRGASQSTVGSGIMPLFYGGGNSTIYYWVVPHSSVIGAGIPMPVGSALPTNGSVSIGVQWPSVNPFGVGTITYDLLATSTTAAPYAGQTANILVASGISGTPSANGMISYTDIQSGYTSYSVPALNAGGSGPAYFGLWFWPGSNVIDSGGTVGTPNFIRTEVWLTGRGNTATAGSSYPSVKTLSFQSGSSTPDSSLWVESLAGYDTGNSAGLTSTFMMQSDIGSNGPAANSKGRINLQNLGAGYPCHSLTLQDSKPFKTIATVGHRPSNDVGDVYIGQDATGQLMFGGPTSISQYVNNVGDNSSWLEKLTATKKQFSVPVQLASYAFASLPSSPANGWMVYCSDCMLASPCSGSGTGAVAKYIASNWVCN